MTLTLNLRHHLLFRGLIAKVQGLGVITCQIASGDYTVLSVRITLWVDNIDCEGPRWRFWGVIQGSRRPSMNNRMLMNQIISWKCQIGFHSIADHGELINIIFHPICISIGHSIVAWHRLEMRLVLRFRELLNVIVIYVLLAHFI